MKITFSIITLLLTCTLFAQQPDLELEWKNNSYLFDSYSLGKYGTIYFEQDGKYFYRIHYLSMDGKTSWKSKKLQDRPGGRALVFADEQGFTICPSPYYTEALGKATTKGAYFRYDYTGKLIEDGKMSCKNRVIALLKSGAKYWFLIESISNNTISSNWLPTCFLQEINPKNLEPVGQSQKLNLPEKRYDFGLGHVMAKVKGTVAVYWTLAGYNDNYLLFYGKKTDATAGKTQFEFVKIDFKGKKLEEFNLEIALDNGKFVNRTRVQKNINEGSEAYKSESQYSAQVLDPGNYGGCQVDFAADAIYLYGCFDNEPDNAQTKPEGYFIQKFTLSGKSKWRYQTRDDLIDQGKKYEPWWPTSLTTSAETGLVTLFDFPGCVFSIDSTGANARFYPIAKFQGKEADQRIDAGIADTHRQPGMYVFHHLEITSENLLQAVYGVKNSGTIKAFLEKYGHSTAIYQIQQNQTSFQVLEIDPIGSRFQRWQVK